MQHTYHNLKTVFDAMRYFLEKNLMAVERAGPRFGHGPLVELRLT
jgi:hypothetical protein